MSYNLLNLPQQVDILSPVGEARNTYVYAANGTKLQVVKKYNSNYNSSPIIGSAVNTSNLDVTKTTDYVGNLIFENDVLDRILVDGGYIKDGVYYFYETDHLGDNRVVVNQSGTVVERDDYYPYGMQMGHNELTNSASGTDNKYKYNGKELDVMHGLNLYDYAARMQDPTLGRFTTVDPLAEKYYSISPYAYCLNNPLRYVDPDGKDIVVANKADRVAVLKMINSKALGLYAFDKNGKLYQARTTGDASKYSKYYADRLNAAIKDKDVINVKIGQNFTDSKGVVKDVDKDAGGGVTQFSTNTKTGALASSVDVTISGNDNKNLTDQSGNTLEDKPADILAHELVGHAIPVTVGSDTGNAVDNENKVRNEVKKTGQTGSSPLRKKESWHSEK